MCLRQKVKHTTTKTKNANMKILARAGNRTRDRCHCILMRGGWTIESTERTDLSQAMYLF